MLISKTVDAEGAARLLSELIATNKEMVNEIKRLSDRIDLLEGAEQKYSPNKSALSVQLRQYSYYWTSTSLHEKRKGSDKSKLQVSRDDFTKAFAAIEKAFELKKHIDVKSIRAQMEKERGSVVPSTQLYLVLRYLKANQLIRKSGGSTYEYIGKQKSEQFLKDL